MTKNEFPERPGESDWVGESGKCLQQGIHDTKVARAHFMSENKYEFWNIP
jgi:hypothetical protein